VLGERQPGGVDDSVPVALGIAAKRGAHVCIVSAKRSERSS
jgi:hypothetical protein